MFDHDHIHEPGPDQGDEPHMICIDCLITRATNIPLVLTAFAGLSGVALCFIVIELHRIAARAP
jgi:hypothetical protein